MRRLLLFGWFIICGVTLTFAQSDSIVMKFLQETHGVTFTAHNEVELLPSGKEKFARMFEDVKNARHSIHMEYFNFRNDSISHELFHLLEERAKAGVEVRILFDAFGNKSNNRPLHKCHLDSLRAVGIQIFVFRPFKFPWLNHIMGRDHRKIVVIDGKIAYTGGMNVADYYLNGTKQVGEWRDMHLRIVGETVAELQTIFMRAWNKQTKDTLQGEQYFPPSDTPETCRMGVVNREPKRSPKVIRETFAEAIDAAQKQIQIVNPYFTLNKRINRALKRAIKRGVDVQIMISANSDIPLTPRAVEYAAHKLMQCGAHVYVYRGGFHHTKVMTVDSCMTFVGSANLDHRSLCCDYECNVLITDKAKTAEFQRIYERDKETRCYMLTEGRWHQYWSRCKRMKCQISRWFRIFL